MLLDSRVVGEGHHQLRRTKGKVGVFVVLPIQKIRSGGRGVDDRNAYQVWIVFP